MMNEKDIAVKGYIEKRVQEGALDVAIAAELGVFQKVTMTAADVAKIREDMGRPSQVDQAALKYAQTKNAEVGFTSEPKLEQAARKPPVVQEKFKKIAEPVRKREIPVPVTGDKISFERQMPGISDMHFGQIYILPGVGAIRYQGKGNNIISGFSIAVVKFKGAYTYTESLHDIPEYAFKEKNIRNVADAKFLENLFGRMHGGDVIPEGVTAASHLKASAYNDLLKSDDLEKIASALLHACNDERGTVYLTEFSNKATGILAGEYAAAAKIEYRDAMDVVNHSAGRKTLAYLRQNFERPKPAI